MLSLQLLRSKSLIKKLLWHKIDHERIAVISFKIWYILKFG